MSSSIRAFTIHVRTAKVVLALYNIQRGFGSTREVHRNLFRHIAVLTEVIHFTEYVSNRLTNSDLR